MSDAPLRLSVFPCTDSVPRNHAIGVAHNCSAPVYGAVIGAWLAARSLRLDEDWPEDAWHTPAG